MVGNGLLKCFYMLYDYMTSRINIMLCSNTRSIECVNVTFEHQAFTYIKVSFSIPAMNIFSPYFGFLIFVESLQKLNVRKGHLLMCLFKLFAQTRVLVIREQLYYDKIS